MTERIAVIQGHPDPVGSHLGHALSEAYAQAAIEVGHNVRIIEIGKLDFPFLRSKSEWETTPVPSELKHVQHDLLWAEHWALFYPLWFGDMPAMLKAFLEQVLRPGLAYVQTEPGQMWDKFLIGRSARIVVTMAIPTVVYRTFYAAHTVKSLERNVLKFCGIDPVKTTLIGNVYNKSQKQHEKTLAKIADYGARGI